VRIGEEEGTAVAGDAIVVPSQTAFELTNATNQTLRLVCCMPGGGQARLDDGTTFTPPWAE
jgi:mannose-6-phosphate isomerase-like protein (cupin superfamily)